MDDWKKFNETSLTEKKRFLQSLKYGNITDADYMHAKDCKDFETKNLGVYNGLYVSSDTLTVCSCHVRYAFQSESTLYSCLNVKELLA